MGSESAFLERWKEETDSKRERYDRHFYKCGYVLAINGQTPFTLAGSRNTYFYNLGYEDGKIDLENGVYCEPPDVFDQLA